MVRHPEARRDPSPGADPPRCSQSPGGCAQRVLGHSADRWQAAPRSFPAGPRDGPKPQQNVISWWPGSKSRTWFPSQLCSPPGRVTLGKSHPVNLINSQTRNGGRGGRGGCAGPGGVARITSREHGARAMAQLCFGGPFAPRPPELSKPLREPHTGPGPGGRRPVYQQEKQDSKHLRKPRDQAGQGRSDVYGSLEAVQRGGVSNQTAQSQPGGRRPGTASPCLTGAPASEPRGPPSCL